MKPIEKQFYYRLNLKAVAPIPKRRLNYRERKIAFNHRSFLLRNYYKVVLGRCEKNATKKMLKFRRSLVELGKDCKSSRLERFVKFLKDDDLPRPGKYVNEPPPPAIPGTSRMAIETMKRSRLTLPVKASKGKGKGRTRTGLRRSKRVTRQTDHFASRVPMLPLKSEVVRYWESIYGSNKQMVVESPPRPSTIPVTLVHTETQTELLTYLEIFPRMQGTQNEVPTIIQTQFKTEPIYNLEDANLTQNLPISAPTSIWQGTPPTLAPIKTTPSPPLTAPTSVLQGISPILVPNKIPSPPLTDSTSVLQEIPPILTPNMTPSPPLTAPTSVLQGISPIPAPNTTLSPPLAAPTSDLQEIPLILTVNMSPSPSLTAITSVYQGISSILAPNKTPSPPPVPSTSDLQEIPPILAPNKTPSPPLAAPTSILQGIPPILAPNKTPSPPLAAPTSILQGIHPIPAPHKTPSPPLTAALSILQEISPIMAPIKVESPAPLQIVSEILKNPAAEISITSSVPAEGGPENADEPDKSDFAFVINEHDGDNKIEGNSGTTFYFI